MATRDEVRRWLVANVGARHVTYDSNGNSIGAQCVGLINAYTAWLGYPRIGGLYAYQLFDNAKQFSQYEVIPNSATFVPQLGDILVYGAGSFGSSVGHIEIAGDNCTLNVVDALAQNYINASATKGSPAAWVKHGYGIFRGVIRPRLTQPIQQPPANPPKGGDMPVRINLDTARILTHGVLARNGLSGRGNSLDGGYDPDLKSHHVGQELTNEYLQGLFLSGEGRQWRDSQDPNSIQGINARLASAAKDAAAKISQINALNNQVSQLTTDKKNLNAIADSTAHERDELRTQLAKAQTELNAANEKLKAVPIGGELDQATKDTINQTGQDVSWIKSFFTAVIEAVSKWRAK
ncbi:hypothetical protein HAV21_03590 [Paenarthrobacter sp. MSM-2-10-13]|uniref:CHAP domain-containing protein n=1 Tax=Paenarthrobacter sp. MSM-2-10-13 TaxID=2717318 RepID=UPI001423F630|nr:CHAP domain-containing protein [Paenarthrobacter sp. MSM-2-10-13]NHW45981.1 hypothetical protein [Paenarthrobacter sp. MSM-2-10-13]